MIVASGHVPCYSKFGPCYVSTAVGADPAPQQGRDGGTDIRSSCTEVC